MYETWVVTGVVAAMLSGMLAYRLHGMRLLNERWGQLAARHQLTFAPWTWIGAPSLEGTIDGTFVRIATVTRSAGKSQERYVAVFAASGHPLPAGLEVRAHQFSDGLKALVGFGDLTIDDEAIDAAAHIRGDDAAAVREVLTHPEVRPRLLRLLDGAPWNRIADGGVILEERGVEDLDLDTNLSSALSLAKALGDAASQPWKQLAGETRLSLQAERDTTRLEGTSDGLPCVVVVSNGLLNKPPGCEVRITLPDHLPAFEAHRAEPGDPPGVVLGDPILDGRVRLESLDPDAVRALFTGPRAEAVDLRGALLAAVHGNERSTLVGGEIRLRSEGATAATARALLQDGRALARALVAAAGTAP